MDKGLDQPGERSGLPHGSAPIVSGPKIARLEAERSHLQNALREILFARPGGPCRSKLVEKIENIARAALEWLAAGEEDLDQSANEARAEQVSPPVREADDAIANPTREGG